MKECSCKKILKEEPAPYRWVRGTYQKKVGRPAKPKQTESQKRSNQSNIEE